MWNIRGGGAVPRWNGWSFFKPSDIPDQGTDTNDCGVHVYLWAYVVCAGVSIQPKSEDFERMRMWIMKEVMDEFSRRAKKYFSSAEVPLPAARSSTTSE